MSSKASAGGGGCGGSGGAKGGGGGGGGGGGSKGADVPWTEGGSGPTIVSGHQYHTYAQGNYGSERYVYIGKEDGVPEFIDYGPKGGKK
jgi:hypothetical protein